MRLLSLREMPSIIASVTRPATPAEVMALIAPTIDALASSTHSWELTSWLREDEVHPTDHDDGSCIDVAPRPVFYCRNLVYEADVWAAVARLLSAPVGKRVAYVVVEPDHLHIRFGQPTARTRVFAYSHPGPCGVRPGDHFLAEL